MSRHDTWRKLAGVLALGAALVPLEAAGGVLDEIIDRTLCKAYLSFHAASNGRVQAAMTILDGQQRKRTRDFTILRRDLTREESSGKRCVDTRYYLYFHRPADVRKTAFMVWTHQDRADDRWMYLPALDLVKRISAGDERTSFVGSHFFYEDVAGRAVDADQHELLETGENYHLVRGTPKDPAQTDFSAYKMWVHRGTFIPVKIEYFDRNGDLYRVYEVLEVQEIGGHPTVVRSRMRDLRSGGETGIEFTSVQYDVDMPADIFAERYLRNPPREQLR